MRSEKPEKVASTVIARPSSAHKDRACPPPPRGLPPRARPYFPQTGFSGRALRESVFRSPLSLVKLYLSALPKLRNPRGKVTQLYPSIRGESERRRERRRFDPDLSTPVRGLRPRRVLDSSSTVRENGKGGNRAGKNMEKIFAQA